MNSLRKIVLLIMSLFALFVIVSCDNTEDDIPLEEQKNPGNYYIFTEKQDGTLSIKSAKASILPQTLDIPSEHDGKTVTEIEDSAFRGSSVVMHVIIPDTVTVIGQQAFSACRNLGSVTVPESVEKIGANAFEFCTRLKTVEINSQCAIPEYAFKGCSALSEVRLSDRVKSIGLGAFSDCVSLENMYIPKGIENVENAAFMGCTAFKSIEVSSDNPFYMATNGCLIEKEPRRLVAATLDCIVPDDGSVRIIGPYSFYGRTDLKEIKIPNGVVTIGKYAFFGCNNATHVSISVGVKEIGNFAFYGCDAIDGFSVPSEIEYFGKYALPDINLNFYTDEYAYYLGNKETPNVILVRIKNKNAEEFKVPDGTRIISYEAFSGCSKLEKVELPETVKGLSDYAFYNCKSLKSIELPKSLLNIGPQAFENCSSLSAVNIPRNVKLIGSRVFAGCTVLVSMNVDEYNQTYYSAGNCVIMKANGLLICGCRSSVIPQDKGIMNIAEDAFYNCRNIKSAIIPEGVEIIGANAFNGCSSLQTVEVPSTLKNIQNSAFSNCGALDRFEFNGTQNEWGNVIFGTNAFRLSEKVKFYFKEQ